VQQPGATDIDGKPISGTVAPGEETIQSVTGSEDGKTVTVVLKQAFAEWRALFVRPLLPAHIARRVGWNTGFDKFDPSIVISGGPFAIQSYNPGRDLTLVRNNQYWGKPANLDSIVIRFIPDSAAAVSALRNNEVDATSPRAQTDIIDQLKGIPNIESQVVPGLEAEFLDLNTRSELLAQREVRQAFALALDRRAVVQRTVGQVDTRAAVMNNRLFVTTQPGYADNSGGRYESQNIPEAKRLLEGAGFALGGDGIYVKDGKRLSLRIRTTAGDLLRESQEELIQAQVKQAGIELTIDNAPTAALIPQLTQGNFDVASLAQNLSIYPTTASSTFGSTGGSNLTKYANPQVDTLFAQAKGTYDDSRRLALLQEIDKILWTDMPRVPLYQRPVVLGFRNTYLNIGVNPSLGPFWNAEQWGIKANPRN
jgi:peptide/nickel transport system substrate-binding protein